MVRRNASDKLKLIQMVHDNPILWDSRLPNFKGAEEEKNRAWEMIGKEFNAPGRRVARAFKSLRESYRRELAHVKLMGNNFKPKWSLYEAMDFLRDVIRERKGGSHAIEHSGPLSLNLSALAQHISNAAAANNHNNNNNNNNIINNNKNSFKMNSVHSSFSDSALNLSKCSSSLNASGDDYYYYVKPELDLSNQNTNPNAVAQQHHQQQQQQLATAMGASNSNNAPNHTPAHQQQHTSQTPTSQQQQHHNDSRVSSTRNDSTGQNNTYDDLDNSSMRSGDEDNNALSNQGSDEVEELEAIDADFPFPLILNSNSPNTNGGPNVAVGGPQLKRRRKHLTSTGGDDEDNDGEVDDDDEDDYEGQMLQQHRHLRAQNMANGLTQNGIMGDMMPPPQTVREVLNSKFCGFISAKLNSMEDSEADNLMNKILMLLVQTQMNNAAAAAVAAASSTPPSGGSMSTASFNELAK
ncbi:rho GTPase-activating protein gacU isoform X4 [Stomoxys calcitrans]|uniref:MADF domain-containing protein n=1 Tax=Stomoxys calcitrans TaxID=35570 RepID=A0A1I8QAR7_STOCA|nr:rho GTPase-activating protein gacU isoform X2 [Stomoxys calcitrans]XP_013113720.1 rho GTPase-activating protein gacU isoform X3 [Stomoxys calcitrans]XP_013113721.1 rho GTPase-activating protein gacU isoform X4 [Stomoxys calcitrans]